MEEEKPISVLWWIIIVLVIIIIFVGIGYFTNNDPGDKIMTCISDKAYLFSSSDCSHCKMQETILGKYKGIFNNTDCMDFPEICAKYNVTSTPTWIIFDQNHEGVKSIKQLKDLTNCNGN